MGQKAGLSAKSVVKTLFEIVLVAQMGADPYGFCQIPLYSVDSENGTQYFPYESVYAVGELKSSYYKKKKYVKKYISSVKKVLDSFSREPVPSNYIGHGVQVKGLLVSGARDVQNQLFSFMLFGSKNDCELVELNHQLCESNSLPNPNIICFIDGSVITRAHLVEDEKDYVLGSLEIDPLRQDNDKLGLVEINFTHENKSGHALAVLMLGLIQHLNATRLKSPPFHKYISSVLMNSPNDPQLVREPSS